MYRFFRVVRNKRGEMHLYVIIVLIVTLIIFSGILQTVRVYSYAEKAQSLVENALSASCIQNYTDIYYGMREGNTGNYQPDGRGNFTSAANSDGVKGYLINNCGFHSNGSTLSKTDSDGNVLFGIKNLSVSTVNPTDGSANFKETATFTLAVPIIIAGNVLPNITVQLKVTGGYVMKF